MKDQNIFNPTMLSKGLLKDVTPSKHDAENTSFVLNGIYSDDTGNLGSLQNEPGNSQCWELPEGFVTVGHGNISRRGVLVCSTNGFTSEIGIANNCEYSTLIRSSCLNFNTKNLVKVLFRSIKNCGDIIYFYDGEEYDKSINIDSLEDYTLNNSSAEEANDNDLWDCNKMKLEPDYVLPFISEAVVKNSGGNTDYGNYKFAIEILDADLNRIGFSEVSNSVSIYDESLEAGWTAIDGGLTGFNDTPPTNKSIKLTVSNLDRRFDYFRVWWVQYTTEDGITPQVYAKGDVVPISESNQDYIFTGLDTSNGDTQEDIEALTTRTANFIASKAMTFASNRLVRSNLKEVDIDWAAFQRATSQIKAKYTIKEIKSNDPQITGSEKSPNTTFELMSNMGDEVYPYSVVYEFKQGFLSPPFLTIGRPANTYTDGSTIGTVDQDYIPDPDTGQNWDDGTIGTWNVNLEHIYPSADEYNALADSEKLKRYQVYNTAIKTGSLSGEMAYHQNENSVYPVIKDCDGNSIWGTDAYGNELEGTPIRHHRFPDRVIEPHYEFTGTEVVQSQTCYSYELPSITEYSFVAVRIVYTIDGGDPIEFYEIVKNTGDASFNPPLDHVWLCTDPEKIVSIISQNCYIEDPSVVGNPNTIEFTITDETIEEVNPSGTLRYLGIEFSNITYPHPDIIKHHFVRGDRDSINRTVVDKGVLGQMREKTSEDEVVFAYFPTDNGQGSDFNYFFSAKNLIDGAAVQGEYLRLEGDHTRSKEDPEIRHYNDTFLAGDDFYVGCRWMRYGETITRSSFYNMRIEESGMLDPASEQTIADHEVTNLSMSNKLNVLNTRYVLNTPNRLLRYVGVKTRNDVWGNPFTINYVRTHNGGLTLSDSQEIYGGDAFITNLRVANIVTRGITEGIWGYVIAGLAVIAATVLSVLSAGALSAPAFATAAIIAGAVGVTSVGVAAIVNGTKDGKYDAYLNNTEGDFEAGPQYGTGYQYMVGEYINMWVESEYNYGMRHPGSEDCNSYFKGTNRKQLLEYFANKITYYDETEEEMRVKPIVCPEFYFYNKGYNALSNDNKYIPLPITHDYCDCSRDSNTFIWSERAFEEEIADAMRVFLPLNVSQIGNHSGEVTNLHFDQNRMLVTTRDSMFVVAPNPRTLQTDQETVYTGAGEFFSIPEQEMTKINWGFGGNQGRFNAINTPFGWTYVDQKAGHIFNITPKDRQILSNHGLYYWFKENLPSNINKAIGEDYEYGDSVAHFSGTGLMTTYDDLHKRLILHKRDYKLINPFGGTYGEAPDKEGHLYFEPDTGLWRIFFTGVYAIVTLDNENHFENASWTLSYSYAMQAWTSWHSYKPTYMLNDEITFYTFDNNNISWKHSNKNYGNFYGKQQPFIVEYIVTNPVTNDLDTIHWYSETKEWDTINKSWIDVDNITFNKMLAYNTTQSTGLQELTFLDKNLNPYGNRIGTSLTQKDVILTEEDYKVSEIRNLAIGQPVVTSSWEKIQDEFVTEEGYIDLKSNDDNIDYNLSQYQAGNLKGKYHFVRLYFDGSEEKDLKLLLNLVNTKTYKSVH